MKYTYNTTNEILSVVTTDKKLITVVKCPYCQNPVKLPKVDWPENKKVDWFICLTCEKCLELFWCSEKGKLKPLNYMIDEINSQ